MLALTVNAMRIRYVLQLALIKIFLID